MDIFLKRHIPSILFIGAFIVYLSTICPTVYLGDSGELTTAAFSLGVPHPSGYPLYALLGKLFCFIPIGNVGYRMNLMSVTFSIGALWIVYSIIYKITSSMVSSVFGAFTLAFAPLFWGQAVSAEVYPLHIFFVALLIRIMISWDKERDIRLLALIAFVSGLSFLNHLQTVMLAPSIFFFLIVSDRKGVLNLRTFVTVSVLFIIALTVYIYLPIRTHAGAAIHWGDPDNFRSFIHVVSGENHRSGYIFNKSLHDYFLRSKEALVIVIKQFGMVSLIALWGFIKLPSIRWRISYLGIIVFDFFYTVFLNTINIEVTPFNLPTLIVIAILAGSGISDLLIRSRKIEFKNNARLYQIVKMACCLVPMIFLSSNYKICDQNRNYLAYEHTLNIFRTVNRGGSLFLGGDNNLFPVIYGRIVERMREDVILYDLYNIIFKIPYIGDNKGAFSYYGKWDDLLNIIKKEIIAKRTSSGVYFSLFNPHTVSLPADYSLLPYGILSRVVDDQKEIDQKKRDRIWNYYATVSLEDSLSRDYMNREVAAYHYFKRGKHLILLGRTKPGINRLELASQIGYNSDIVHMELALLFSDIGYFTEAEKELEKSLLYCEDLASVYNHWGYYYSKRHDLGNAIKSIEKAVEIDPDNTLYYNNLGFLLLEVGERDRASEVFGKSLSINKSQEGILKVVKEQNLTNE